MHQHLAIEAHTLALDVGARLLPLPDRCLIAEFDSDLAQDRQRSLVKALKLLSSDGLHGSNAVLDRRDARPLLCFPGGYDRRASSAASDYGSISVHHRVFPEGR